MRWIIQNMMKALVIVYVLCFAQLCWATMGLETNPSQIDVTGVPLGRKVAISKLTKQPVYLEIKNKSDAAYDYVISIRIEASQAKQVELYINIPNKKAYADKKYQAIINVTSKKNNPQDLFILACQLRITLQTKKKGWLRR